MKYKAVIIDDEPKLREVLAIKLNKNCIDIDVVSKASNAEEGYEAILNHKPQIVFLDIAMPGETGFDMLSRFDVIDFEIIFVTGYNEYGLDALKISAVDYLLKPVKTEDLVNAVNKAKIKIEKSTKLEKYENLIFNLNHFGDQKTKLTIPGSDGYEFVAVEDIIRCEGWQKYTKIILSNGETIVSSYNLGVFKEMLLKYDFYETHKSHIINKTHILKYLKEGYVIMSDDSQVPVSRRKKDDFYETFIRN
jgi:two-component system LytT family response regulator